MELVKDPGTINNVLNYWQQTQAPAPQQGGDSMFPNIDASLSGEDYLKQFPAEIQQGVRDYVGGLSMPTGNPRKTNIIKFVAGKYGADIGMPADDSSFTARRNMRSQLSNGGPSSLGGQFRNGTTAMEHLASVGGAMTDLNNVGGLGVAPLAHAINATGALTTEGAGKRNSLNSMVQHYGQEITKFYAGSPGGEAERMRFLNSMSPNMSPAEMADVLEAELNLIPAKMDQIRGEVGSTLGGKVPDWVNEHVQRQEAAAASVRNTIAKLRGLGGSSAPQQAAPQQAPQQAPQAAVPNAAIQFLRNNPNLRDQFDAKYGQGMAARVLGQ